METNKIYKIGPNPEAALNAKKSWDSYGQAHEAKGEAEDITGMSLDVYKIMTTVTTATHTSEDYWPY